MGFRFWGLRLGFRSRGLRLIWFSGFEGLMRFRVSCQVLDTQQASTRSKNRGTVPVISSDLQTAGAGQTAVARTT